MTASGGRPPFLAVALVSVVTLAWEIVLTRLLAIIQWHHFAWMVISLALLGFGAAGTVLALARSWLVARAPVVFPLLVLAFACAIAASFAAAQAIPFNAEELFWDFGQYSRLAAVYLLLSAPFFLAGLTIGLALTVWRRDLARLYGADLLGAGAGSLLAVGVLALLAPARLAAALAAVALLAAIVAAVETAGRRLRLALCAVAVAALGVTPALVIEPQLSPYKPLAQMLEVSGTAVIEQRSGPLGLVTVVESRAIPLRHAPGLSLRSAHEPPPQLALFVDGDGMSAISRFNGSRDELAWLDDLPSAAAYHAGAGHRVAVLGAGGGSGILQALHHGAHEIHAVELDPRIVELVGVRFADFSGGLYARPEVRVHIADARAFTAAPPVSFDLIQLELVDSFAGSASGQRSLSESYLYTVEAVTDYLEALAPGGYLSITRWVDVPPRESLKLLATAAAALEGLGVSEPGRRVALIRGLQTATLLVRNGDWSTAAIERLRRFCRERAFDVAWHPGIEPGDANRFNRLDRPWYHEGARALLSGEAADFLQRYKFDLAPATDDRPFFHSFMKWRTLPELWSLRGRGGMPLVEWGTMVLVATLIQAAIAAVILIVMPLLVLRRLPARTAGDGWAWRAPLCFGAVGLGFLFVELAMLHKLILFLQHPVYATVTVLASILVFAGFGSIAAGSLITRLGHATLMAAAVSAVVIATVGARLAFDGLASHGDWPIGARVAATVAVIAPLAFAMGLPFPTALARLGEEREDLIPWAWAINGCASVVSAVLATTIAVEAGFDAVLVGALVCYVIAAAVLPRTSPAS